VPNWASFEPDLRDDDQHEIHVLAAGAAPVTVGIVNPRLGTFVECTMDRLTDDIAGVSPNRLLQQIIFDVSAAEISL
jgi:hypothetical protein